MIFEPEVYSMFFAAMLLLFVILLVKTFRDTFPVLSNLRFLGSVDDNAKTIAVNSAEIKYLLQRNNELLSSIEAVLGRLISQYMAKERASVVQTEQPSASAYINK